MKAALGLIAGAALCLAPQAAAAPATAPLAPAPAARQAAAPAADPAYKILVFSRTAGFRHDSIDEGVTALRDLGAANNFTVTATEDPAAFTTVNLAQYRAVVFLSTTGDVLGPAQESAFEQYLGSGGGYVGIHAAPTPSTTGRSTKAWPAPCSSRIPRSSPPPSRSRTGRTTPPAHLGRTWQRTDEWYNYRTNPRTTAHVLASLDESSYSGGTMPADHPIAWCKDYAGGRAFYTGGGHTAESYADPAFRRHLLGGIRWAAAPPRPTAARDRLHPLFDGAGTTGWKQAGRVASP
ncbi:ThuA domain-containing protein [Streptomyces tendae]|uniref:ThuA domain-containing protein n=1 Tax=Streptomyces tendae TaxID=1932 RepID=UPI001F0D1923|nr:ThuA domain-containing protein [Streptomyces tendae]